MQKLLILIALCLGVTPNVKIALDDTFGNLVVTTLNQALSAI